MNLKDKFWFTKFLGSKPDIKGREEEDFKVYKAEDVDFHIQRLKQRVRNKYYAIEKKLEDVDENKFSEEELSRLENRFFALQEMCVLFVKWIEKEFE